MLKSKILIDGLEIVRRGVLPTGTKLGRSIAELKDGRVVYLTPDNHIEKDLSGKPEEVHQMYIRTGAIEWIDWDQIRSSLKKKMRENRKK